jgi:hypothetical protein
MENEHFTIDQGLVEVAQRRVTSLVVVAAESDDAVDGLDNPLSLSNLACGASNSIGLRRGFNPSVYVRNSRSSEVFGVRIWASREGHEVEELHRLIMTPNVGDEPQL